MTTLLEAARAVPLEHTNECRWMVLSGEYGKGRSAAPEDDDCDCWVGRLGAAIAAAEQAPAVVTAEEIAIVLTAGYGERAKNLEAGRIIAALVQERCEARDKVLALVDVATKIASGEADLSLPQFRECWRAQLRGALAALAADEKARTT